MIIDDDTRQLLIENAMLKAAVVGVDKIMPAGVMRSLDECITVEYVGNRQLIMFYFNIPGHTSTRAVSIMRMK